MFLNVDAILLFRGARDDLREDEVGLFALWCDPEGDDLRLCLELGNNVAGASVDAVFTSVVKAVGGLRARHGDAIVSVRLDVGWEAKRDGSGTFELPAAALAEAVARGDGIAVTVYPPAGERGAATERAPWRTEESGPHTRRGGTSW